MLFARATPDSSAIRSLKFTLLFPLALALLLSACHEKQSKPRPVPQVLAPTIESEPQPAAQPATPPPSATPDTSTQPTADSQPTNHPRLHPRRPVARKPVPPATNDAPKNDAPRSGNPSAPITADLPRAAVQSQRQSAEQMLRSDNDRLARINRALNDGEKNMMQQARSYIAQASQALESGDTERAYNLAVKATLLTNELTK